MKSEIGPDDLNPSAPDTKEKMIKRNSKKKEVGNLRLESVNTSVQASTKRNTQKREVGKLKNEQLAPFTKDAGVKNVPSYSTARTDSWE